MIRRCASHPSGAPSAHAALVPRLSNPLSDSISLYFGFSETTKPCEWAGLRLNIWRRESQFLRDFSGLYETLFFIVITIT